MKFLIACLLCFIVMHSYGQSDTSIVGQDTLLPKFLSGLPEEMHDKFLKEYKTWTPEKRKEILEFIEFMGSMPYSSKKQLIQNIDTNYNNVNALKTYFRQIVAPGYEVYIEFAPAEKLLSIGEYIDFGVDKWNPKTKRYESVFQEWSVEIKSAKLDSLLRLATLNRAQLTELKKYVDKAGCISVKNGKQFFEIGFGRSGMGKYAYLVFDEPLTKDQQKEYDDGCGYIFYKNNIVLEYRGGAVGPQCFPDKE